MIKKYREDITQQSFDEAALKLTKNGQSVTVNNIKKLIGGSKVTLAPMVIDYKRKACIANMVENMPKQFTSQAISFALDLYNHFQELFNKDRIKLQDELNKYTTSRY